MSLPQEALERLNADNGYVFSIQYSNRFSDYNANVRKQGEHITFHLSKKWKGVSREIVIGLLQDLFIRLLKLPKQQTLNTELYTAFIKSLQKTNVNATADPLLEQSFNRVNDAYFDSLLPLPTMDWGQEAKRKLASYDHHTDTITVSSFFKTAPLDMLDYLVYHELLHKKLQFKNTLGRTTHHSAAFKRLEKKFNRAEAIEKEIERFIKEQSSMWRKFF